MSYLHEKSRTKAIEGTRSTNSTIPKDAAANAATRVRDLKAFVVLPDWKNRAEGMHRLTVA
jgi:hypothetical protein